MSKTIYILIIFVLTNSLSSCYKEIPTKKPLLSDQKLVEVLADIHIAEAVIAGYTELSGPQKDSVSNLYYQQIFNLHRIEAKDFEQSMSALMTNPNLMKTIYENILERLIEQETKAPAKKETAKE